MCLATTSLKRAVGGIVVSGSYPWAAIRPRDYEKPRHGKSPVGPAQQPLRGKDPTQTSAAL